ncbi:MAG: tRNA 2-thiouridine(34) synthase MnmA [Proteobacteria bacterium]|nr:tRNA 2-thiouridine(34) synthase MnmA [Pseudomonadota bacterium]
MIPENKAKNLKNKQIVVGLSGGVDSAVAALLLQEAGAQVQAVFMKNWVDDDSEAGCHDKQDLIAAAAVAEALQLPFEVVNFAEHYRQQVFLPFLQELRDGRTPNPDVLCNSYIKFQAFHDYAKQQGAAAMASGHYARNGLNAEGWCLYKAEDSVKDQTYFLHRLNAEQLAYSIFPLGALYKTKVREKARAAGLFNWQRKDSTGICFIGERDFDSFIVRYLPETPGEMQDENGQVVGTHRGLQFYTIGQRRGLNLGGGAPWFVASKNAPQNILQVVQGEHHSLLYRREVKITETHWIHGTPPPANLVYTARLRHRQQPATCTLTAIDATGATILFAEEQRAAAAGQYAVIYDGNLCLGGGVIAI